MASDGVSHSHTLYAQLVSKAQSHEHESELYELAQLAGVTMDPEVFKIVLDLLEMKCSPKTIADVLHSMLKHSTFNSAGELHPDISQSDLSKNTSNIGHRTGSLPTHSLSSHSVSSSPAAHNNSSAGRSGSVDQSRLSNITVRSSSGERRSQGSFSANHSSSRLHSGHNSSSSYLGRGDHKTRKHR